MKKVENLSKKIFLIIIVLAVLLLVSIISKAFTTIPTGYVGIRTRFGKASENIVQEGLNFKIPLIERIILIDCRTQKAETSCGTASRDLQEVSLDVVINYNVERENAYNLFKEVGTNYESIIISPAILESVKSVTAQYTAEELITKRSEVSDKMQETLIEKIAGRGFKVVDFNITDLDFSDVYNQAIEKKQVAEQQAKQAQYELERSKIENERKVAEAEANAKVMKIQNESTTENALRLKEIELKQQLIQKWDGVLPTTMSGDVTSILDVTN